MISSACEQAVNCAMKVHAQVTNKRRKVHFHASDVDHSLDEDDLQDQVNKLKIYRDEANKEDKNSDDSSTSSDGPTIIYVYDLG